MSFSTTQGMLSRRLACLFILLTICLPWETREAFGQAQTIDFEGHAAGEILSHVAGNGGYGGIQVSAVHPACPLRNAAIIFDSSCPGGCSGGDDDLGTPNASFGGPGHGAGGEAGSGHENDTALGNLLIVHQVCSELASNPVTNPRDHGGNATLSLTFPTDVTIFNLTALDLESSEAMQIDFYDRNDVAVGFAMPTTTGDNGKAVLNVKALASEDDFVSGVRRIEILRQGSGALDDIVFEPDATADLELTKVVDNPAPDSGATVVFTLTLVNNGPDAAANVAVDDRVPPGLSLVDHSCEGVTSIEVGTYEDEKGDSQPLITAQLDEIAVGASATCTVTTSVSGMQSVENVAEVMTSDAFDPDSTPGNNAPEEDDQDTAAVTPGESSGGGDGGIESDGNMATHLARRLFNRRIDAQAATALLAAPEPVAFSAGSGSVHFLQKTSTGLIDLRNSVPEEGPHSTLAYEVTPRDLLGITNATGVLAVDYLQLDGRRLGAIFSATSPSGHLYDHTKTSCDRLGGGMLEDVRLVEVNGHPFVLSKLRHIGGDIDYAVSFVAFGDGTSYTIDSRFSPDEYDVPASAVDVVNIQIWGVTPEFTQELLGRLLDELSDQGTLIYQNSARQAPQIYVADGAYEQGVLSLRIANKVGATQITVRGTVSQTESDAEQQVRTPFERTVSLNAPTANHPYSEIAIEVGSIFDAIVFVEHNGSESYDRLYHADGTWSYASGDETEIDQFKIVSKNQLYSFDRYIVERSGTLRGKVKNWASLFRYLRPNGQPVDLSAYTYVSFTAHGEGPVRLITEKAGIDNWDQYGFTFDLSADPKRYKINFSELRKEATYDGPFTAEDVTLLAFYAPGDGQTARDFSINIENLTFGGATHEGIDVPTQFTLDQNFPNPFNPVTQITYALQESMRVKLTVFDMLGREIAVLVDGLQAAGQYDITFNAGNLPSGLYMYRLETQEGNTAKMMSLLK